MVLCTTLGRSAIKPNGKILTHKETNFVLLHHLSQKARQATCSSKISQFLKPRTIEILLSGFNFAWEEKYSQPVINSLHTHQTRC